MPTSTAFGNSFVIGYEQVGYTREKNPTGGYNIFANCFIPFFKRIQLFSLIQQFIGPRKNWVHLELLSAPDSFLPVFGAPRFVQKPGAQVYYAEEGWNIAGGRKIYSVILRTRVLWPTSLARLCHNRLKALKPRFITEWPTSASSDPCILVFKPASRCALII